MPVDARYIEARLQQMNVLLVDDNAFMRRIVRSMLANIGIRNIVQSANGIEALEAIAEACPDVVLLDWEMPVLNGPEFVRIVRSPGVFPAPDLPIIMLTAHGEARRLVEAMQLGVNDFLCKPVSAKALRDRLAAIVVNPRTGMKIGTNASPASRAPRPGLGGKGSVTA
ncbi:MAG: response regulator [Pseudolabrys sp.]|nr:response regulator [Pseudolabrys sp.]